MLVQNMLFEKVVIISYNWKSDQVLSQVGSRLILITYEELLVPFFLMKKMTCQKSFIPKYRTFNAQFDAFHATPHFYAKVIQMKFCNFKKIRYVILY